ncbi:MAG TPA: hypothetical protein VIC08_04960 [Cellvibrionaceae bacterium]
MMMRMIYAPEMMTELKKLWQKQVPLPQPLGFFPKLKLEGGALYEVEPASESRPQYHAHLYTVEYRNDACPDSVVITCRNNPS